MKKIALIASILLTVSISALAQTTSAHPDSSSLLPIANQANIGYDTQWHVHDLAGLFNPTLIDKLETKLKECENRTKLNIKLITRQTIDSDSAIAKSNSDILILLSPQVDSTSTQLQILATGNAALLLPADSCYAIARKSLELFIDHGNYEAGAINAVDNVLTQVDTLAIHERSTTTTLIIIVGIVILSIFFYKFSTASFSDSKKKMTFSYLRRRRKEIEGDKKL